MGAVSRFNGGLVLVTHDARLITTIDCELWVVEDGGCYRFEKGFDGYRDKVLNQLEERQAEVERMEKKRRDERAEKRAQHVPNKRENEKAPKNKEITPEEKTDIKANNKSNTEPSEGKTNSEG